MTAVAHAQPTATRRGAPWTAEEDDFIRANYRSLGAPRTAEALGRSYAATCVRACGLKAQKTTHWSIAEDRRLTLLWGHFPIKEIAEKLGRGEYACAVRGAKIGLERGPQRGMQRLTQQAVRTGFARETLRRILEWAEVEAESVPSCTGYGIEPRKAFCDVEVDEAVSRWMAMEVVAEGARARGIDRSVMMALLMSGKFAVPKRPRSSRWRVPSEALDQAAAFYQGMETAAEGARRHRIVPSTLVEWLRSSGITKSAHPRVRVERAVVDRIVAARRLSTPRSEQPRRETPGGESAPSPSAAGGGA